MKIVIRHEKTSDQFQTEEVAREAFYNLYFPGCHEHYVIHKLRKHQDFIKELSFVIEIDGEIAGSIFYTKASIVDKEGNSHEMISFGPVSIHPKYHRQGIGRQLIIHSIKVAKELGHKAILTLGYDYHYSPYGFSGGKKYGITMPDGLFYKGLLVLPLYENSLEGIQGFANFSDVFDVTDAEVNAYDAMFPPKEKCIQESQKIYEETICLLDE